MGISRLLLLLLVLIASVAVSTSAAQSGPAPPACNVSTLAPKLVRHCQSDPDVTSFLLSPTPQCCEALEASLPAQQEVALPCLCRAAADQRIVAARLDAARLFVLHRGCGKGTSGINPNLASFYCEAKTGDIATEACNAGKLATQVSRFCVTDKLTAGCCRAVVPTVVLNGRPSCLCRVAADPQLAAAGLNGTGILELYAACGGRTPVGPYLVDACKSSNLPAPALAGQGATTGAAVLTRPVATAVATDTA